MRNYIRPWSTPLKIAVASMIAGAVIGAPSIAHSERRAVQVRPRATQAQAVRPRIHRPRAVRPAVRPHVRDAIKLKHRCRRLAATGQSSPRCRPLAARAHRERRR